jgi:hypothetical protein
MHRHPKHITAPPTVLGSRSAALKLALLAAAAITVWLCLPMPAAVAAEEHAFEPILSLTADCSVSELDPVPDPGVCPGTPGVDHPALRMERPCGVATDSFGNIYVADPQNGAGAGGAAHIDVFNAEGDYLTEIPDENRACWLAVDSTGTVYASETEGHKTVSYTPPEFPPTKGMDYGARNVVFPGDSPRGAWGVAVDPSNDHLYIALTDSIREYSSAAEGNALLKAGIAESSEPFGAGLGFGMVGLDVYGANHDIYVSGRAGAANDPEGGRVYILDGTTFALKAEIDGKGTPAQIAAGEGNPDGGFGFEGGAAEIAVDQATGQFFVDDVAANAAVDQLSPDGRFIGQLKHSFTPSAGGAFTAVALAVDSPCRSEPDSAEPCRPGETYASPNEGFVYVAQGETLKKSHLYAFGPPLPETPPPAIRGQDVVSVTTTEATLRAEVNPNGAETSYQFELVSQAEYEAGGYQGAVVVPASPAALGDIPAFQQVSVHVTGLQPATAYRFRVRASSPCKQEEPEVVCETIGEGIPGGVGVDRPFATFLPETGLPDERAYELVTPSDTNGRTPTMTELGERLNGSGFVTALSTPDGDGLAFGTEGGSIPSLGGNGYHDSYEAVRAPGGIWGSHLTAPTGVQAQRGNPGGIDEDHQLSFWSIRGSVGTLAPGGEENTNYIRRAPALVDPACSPDPASGFEYAGCGSLGAEPFARGAWISPGGGHVIIAVNPAIPGVIGKPLEPCALHGAEIYDRTSDGVTHCIALPPEGASAQTLDEFNSGTPYFEGASRDGTAVAFTDADQKERTLYVRVDNERTLEVARGNSNFAGLSDNGGRLFYLRNPLSVTPPRRGQLFVFNTSSGKSTQIGSGGESIVVNISGDGSRIYFASPKVLDADEEGVAGEENLYVWNRGKIEFVAVVTPEDVAGHDNSKGAGGKVGGLGLWVSYAVQSAFDPTTLSPDRVLGPAADPSRTTKDGSVLVFESHRRLTSYDNEGKVEIYRFEAEAEAAGRIACISCSPILAAPRADAQLQSDTEPEFYAGSPVNALTLISNLTADGSSVFFESADQLSVRDTDGKVDVYKWSASTTPGCAGPSPCLRLISGGRSEGDDYLYAVSLDGKDAFFESGDRLVAEDGEATPSIYDARAPHLPGEAVGTPFPAPLPGGCSGEACQRLTPPPDEPPSSAVGGAPPRPSTRPCPRGRRSVRVHGQRRCVKRHKKAGGHPRRRDADRKHQNRRAAR